MKRMLGTLALLGMMGTCDYASAQTAHRSCASFEHLQAQMAQHPELALERTQLENFTQQYAAHHALAQGKQTAVVYTIPVVVHVLYKTATQNISDAQILSQIDVLNKDYQLLNADASGVPAAFSGLKADCQIQFCMAKRDPQGAATTGIIRKSTTKSSFNADNDEAKFNTSGGDNAWPSNQYLNLWVVPDMTSEGVSGVLGYAQFPGGGAANTDGVVIIYSAFGNTGAVSAPFNKGRTASHEVGHWLNLGHIWGDDGSACTGSDNVGDTPNQGSENYGCPSYPHISCSNTPNGDMFMNYMDYTDDACMFMFSQGQKTRMHAVLAPGGLRASITSSQGCSPPSGGTCSAPSGLNATGITTTSATLNWTSVASASSYTLQWKTTAGSTWTTVATVVGTSYSLTGLTAGTSYSFKVLSNCSGTTSAYSTVAAFTTSPVSGCTDNFEPNETRTAAATIAVNTLVSAKIGTTTDNDYFKFTNSSSALKIKVSLTNLAGDYDLKLYNSAGTLLATSENGSTTAESVIYNATSVGTYYAQVYGYNGAYSTTQCYNLNAQTSATSFKENNARSSKVQNNFILYPNPSRGEVSFDYYSHTAATATISIVDQSGRVCKTILLPLAEGQNKPTFNVSDLSAGFYFVRMMAGDDLITAKLFVER